MEPVTLKSDRLLIRPLRAQDAEHVMAAWQDPNIRRWTAVPVEQTLDMAAEFVRMSIEEWREGRNFILGMEVLDTGEFVGTIGIFGLSWVSMSEQLAWVGCWAVGGQRRNGYMAEALPVLAAWAFRELRIDRLEAIVEVGNDASLACALKAGFQMEGTLRSRTVQDGTRRDAWIAALLPGDLGQASSVPYHG